MVIQCMHAQTSGLKNLDRLYPPFPHFENTVWDSAGDHQLLSRNSVNHAISESIAELDYQLRNLIN